MSIGKIGECFSIRGGVIMKRILIISVILAAMLLSACGPSFDEKGSSLVDAYAEEIIPALDVAIFLFGVWAQDTTDEEVLINLQESMVKLQTIEEKHWADMPEYNEIKTWMYNRSIGENKWVVDGEELAEAVYGISNAAMDMAGPLEAIINAGGNVDKIECIQGENLNLEAFDLTHVPDKVDKLRWILFRK